MLQYPDIDPVALSLGPLQIHWYGIMYLIGFGGGWALALHRAKQPGSGWSKDQVADLTFYVALGVVIGGRLGYILLYTLLYDPGLLLEDPLVLVRVWEGGMSFHGGLLGVVLAVWLFCRHTRKPVMKVLDFVAPVVPIGLGAGRLGNFIGAELWGRPTEMPWGMVFPGAGPRPRHPSQLYEFFLEGVVMFAVLWWYSSKPRPTGAVAALFAILYGVFRIFVEFFREPDEHIGYLAFGWFTQGMLLSLPLVLVGAFVMALAYKDNTFEKLARRRQS